tara:strand:+ start:238 stop:1011 length:774 start_codon:yes stop_codon:yes gene_type:complete
MHHLNFPFELGYWLFFDAIEMSLYGTSILQKIKNKWRLGLYLLFAGALIGLVLDFFGVYISKVWQYPVINTPFELLMLYIDWGLVILMVYSSYRVFLYLAKELVGRVGIKLASKRVEKRIYPVLGIISVILLIVPFVFQLFFSTESISIISIGAVFLGLWFLAEYVEYQRMERSLLKDILDGYWTPLIAIVAGSVVLGLVWETMNLPVKAWIYTNIPLSNVQILGVPLLIIIGWPALFVIYLSSYRALFKGRDVIWK